MNSPIQALASLVTEKFILAAPGKAAATLETLATHEVLQLVSSLKAQTLIALFNAMDSSKAAAVLRRLPLRQSSYVLARLEVPQAAKLWKEFATPYQARLKSVLDPAFVELLQAAGWFAVGTVAVSRLIRHAVR